MAQAARLDDLDRAEAAILERLNGGGLRLREYITKRFPHEPPPRHLDPLIKAIERARHRRVKILLSMPPGHAKTLTILRAIAWWLAATPADTNAYLSYSDMQGWSKSKLTREITEEAGVELHPEFTAAAEWRTRQGGGLLASGVGGRLTGNRVTGFAVIDDPYKSQADAASAATREEVWTWYTSVVRTRLQDASIIVVHTRWHPDDLIGRLERAGGWEVINLPAIAENDNAHPDPLGRAAGEALWPEMYSAAELKDIGRDVGEFVFSALYQGRPRTPGAKIFVEPARFDLKTFDPTGCIFGIGVDPAGSKKTSADWSVAILMAMRKRTGDLPLFYFLQLIRHQATVPTFVKLLRQFQINNGNVTAWVEAVAGFKAVPDMLREVEGSLLVQDVHPAGDKFQRAQPLAAAWNDQRALVPIAAPWDVEGFLAEYKEFTGLDGELDDRVDAGSTIFNALKSNQPPPPPTFTRPSGPILPRRR
jgi:predicted phage terminase large subunit-like protein